MRVIGELRVMGEERINLNVNGKQTIHVTYVI